MCYKPASSGILGIGERVKSLSVFYERRSCASMRPRHTYNPSSLRTSCPLATYSPSMDIKKPALSRFLIESRLNLFNLYLIMRQVGVKDS